MKFDLNSVISSAYRIWIISSAGALIVATLWFFSINDLKSARKIALLANNRELSSLASALAEQTAASMQGVKLVLQSTASWESGGERLALSDEGINAFLRGQIIGLPQIRELSVLNEGGTRIASSQRPLIPNVNIRAREYFRELKSAPLDTWIIGEPMRSLVDGKSTFALAELLPANARAQNGIVVALVQEDYFTQLYNKVNLGPGAAIRLLKANGTLLVISDDSPPSGFSATIATCKAVRSVPGFPLKIEVSRDENVALSEWTDTARQTLIRTACISILVGLLVFAINLQMRRLQYVHERLRSSERRWRTVFESTPVGVTASTLHGHLSLTNPAFQRMLGYSAEALNGASFTDLTHVDDQGLFERELAKLRSGELQRTEFQLRYLHCDGEAIWAEVSIERVIEVVASENPSMRQPTDMLVSTVMDVSERYKAERERDVFESKLREAHRLEALGIFAAGISHDFNNILGAIIGYGERALMSLSHHAPERAYLEQVMTAGHRAQTLVDQILMFSRKGIVMRTPVQLIPVIREAIDLMLADLSPLIHIDARFDASNPVVNGDSTHIHQLIMNLCTNAVQAMPGGGTLSMRLARANLASPLPLSHAILAPGDYVRISVSDTGVGIDPGMMDRIFMPFFTTRGVGHGTGLGLSLIDGIVKEYGGAVDVHSVMGKSTVFHVYLPLLQTVWTPDAELEPLAVATPTSRLHGEGQVVMVVDDEHALVSLVEEMLATLGYEPVGFVSSMTAWEAFEAAPQRFDAIITDQSMPEMTGLQLIDHIRGIRTAMPVALCTGYHDAHLEREAAQAGVSLILKKPLLQSDVEYAMRQLLQGEAPAATADERRAP